MDKQPRGTMSPEDRKRVTSLGGRAVSQDRSYMAKIGRKGGLAVSKDRAHMAAIGAKGRAGKGKRKTT